MTRKSSGPGFTSREAQRAHKRIDELHLIPGQTGPSGPSGLSAYQVALNNGFIGTEPQWLASLIGEVGPQGPDGLPNITAINTPSRSLNTNFQPHATRPTVCIYSFQLHTVLTALGVSSAGVELRSDANPTPTTSRVSIMHQIAIGIGLFIDHQSDGIYNLTHVVPAGHYVRLVPSVSGSGTITSISQTEIVL